MATSKRNQNNMLTIPNALTLLRLFAVPVFLYASFRGEYRLAFFLFVGAMATDILDGVIARRFNQRSPSWAGKASTTLQAFTLATTIEINAFGPALVGFAQVLFRLVVLATLFSGWDYLRKGKGMIAVPNP
jgi:phosphatidylglycerophosphate synthase